MSAVGLFAIGVVVTLIVGFALGLLVYGAILDGRYAAERKAEEALQPDRASSPATGRRPERQPERNGADMPHNIVETAREAGTFQTLLSAVDAAGLGESLADGGPFTVFAPTDDAFATLPQATLNGLLADPRALARVLTYQRPARPDHDGPNHARQRGEDGRGRRAQDRCQRRRDCQRRHRDPVGRRSRKRRHPHHRPSPDPRRVGDHRPKGT